MENTMTMSKSYEQKMLERRSELFEQARGDEALEKRRENIKQFHLGHGRYQAVVFPEPVHYQEDGDGWKDIDNNLDDATDAAGRPILRNRANSLRVELSKSADSGKLARIESGGRVLEWSLDGMPAAVAPVIGSKMPIFTVSSASASVGQSRAAESNRAVIFFIEIPPRFCLVKVCFTTWPYYTHFYVKNQAKMNFLNKQNSNMAEFIRK